MSELSYELAKRRVHRYKDESEELIQAHQKAMECRDCEDFLQQGLDALDWLRKAESLFREADYEGISEYTEELRNSIRTLYIEWLSPCKYAEEMIQRQVARGYSPDNLKAFQDACSLVQDIVERIDWHTQISIDNCLESEPW